MDKKVWYILILLAVGVAVYLMTRKPEPVTPPQEFRAPDKTETVVNTKDFEGIPKAVVKTSKGVLKIKREYTVTEKDTPGTVIRSEDVVLMPREGYPSIRNPRAGVRTEWTEFREPYVRFDMTLHAGASTNFIKPSVFFGLGIINVVDRVYIGLGVDRFGVGVFLNTPVHRDIHLNVKWDPPVTRFEDSKFQVGITVRI